MTVTSRFNLQKWPQKIASHSMSRWDDVWDREWLWDWCCPQLYRNALKGWPQGVWKWGEEVAFSWLQKVNKPQLSQPISHNNGHTFWSIPFHHCSWKFFHLLARQGAKRDCHIVFLRYTLKGLSYATQYHNMMVFYSIFAGLQHLPARQVRLPAVHGQGPHWRDPPRRRRHHSGTDIITFNGSWSILVM